MHVPDLPNNLIARWLCLYFFFGVLSSCMLLLLVIHLNHIMNIARTTRLQRQISALRPQFSIHSDALRSLGRQPTRSLYVSSICKAKAEPVTIHVRSTNTSKKGQNQARNTYAGQEKVKGGKKDSLWKSWQNLTLGTKMGVAFAIGCKCRNIAKAIKDFSELQLTFILILFGHQWWV